MVTPPPPPLETLRAKRLGFKQVKIETGEVRFLVPVAVLPGSASPSARGRSRLLARQPISLSGSVPHAPGATLSVCSTVLSLAHHSRRGIRFSTRDSLQLYSPRSSHTAVPWTQSPVAAGDRVRAVCAPKRGWRENPEADSDTFPEEHLRAIWDDRSGAGSIWFLSKGRRLNLRRIPTPTYKSVENEWNNISPVRIPGSQDLLPSWLSGKESTLQCNGHRFNPWSGKIPHASKQLSPRATTTEARGLWSPCSTTREATATRSPRHCNERVTPAHQN
ncbi:uncharacterized protein LOC133055585 [Dama dama]|uniref:uncharacterized protein LOC133055585 n=1 Tax=Dama dama TaxID=30532 RepID=UPI002A362E59|nr:uncharacterized protein LOC133055585 [Dama dama]